MADEDVWSRMAARLEAIKRAAREVNVFEREVKHDGGQD